MDMISEYSAGNEVMFVRVDVSLMSFIPIQMPIRVCEGCTKVRRVGFAYVRKLAVAFTRGTVKLWWRGVLGVVFC